MRDSYLERSILGRIAYGLGVIAAVAIPVHLMGCLHWPVAIGSG
jgi:hypothetical protein